MKRLTDNFNCAYPHFSSVKFQGCCTIEEPLNRNSCYFQELVLTGIDGYTFPHELSCKMSSFAKSSGHLQCLRKDCDGILFTEKSDKKYVILCELKSSFSSDEIADAKDQLVGSYINLMGVLSTLQGFDRNSYIVKGIIASFSPSQEIIDALTKKMTTKVLLQSNSITTNTTICQYPNAINSFILSMWAILTYIMFLFQIEMIPIR